MQCQLQLQVRIAMSLGCSPYGASTCIPPCCCLQEAAQIPSSQLVPDLDQLAELATTYACSLVTSNLEGLQRLLSQVERECRQWPALSASFCPVIDTSQALVKARYGHTIRLASTF